MARKKKSAAQFVSGIDVSQFQLTVDWTKVKAAGAQFVFIKASEGVTITDPNFAVNRQGAKAAGLICGAYHLFRPRDTVQAQVDNFVAAVGTVEVGELPPVLDVEVPADWIGIAGDPEDRGARSPRKSTRIERQARRGWPGGRWPRIQASLASRSHGCVCDCPPRPPR